MPRLADALTLASTQDGVVSRVQLLEAKWHMRAITRLLERGEFVPVHPGVYRCASTPLERAQRLRAAALSSPDARLSHTTAGQHWEVRAMSDPRIHVLLPHEDRLTLDGVVVHRCRRIDDVDTVTLDNGLRVTSPPRTLFDAASIIGVDRTTSALEHVLARKLCTIGTIMATVERLAHPRRPGTHTMRTVLASRPVWAEAVQSELELRMATALVDAGFPQPVRQFPVALDARLTVHLDLAYPQWMIAIEVDHPYWHDPSSASARDKERDRRLSALGWRVVRVTDADVAAGLATVLDDLRAIIAQAS